MAVLVLGGVPPGAPYFSLEGFPRWLPCLTRARGDDGKLQDGPHAYFVPGEGDGLLCPACRRGRRYPVARDPQEAMDWDPRQRAQEPASSSQRPFWGDPIPAMTPDEIEAQQRAFRPPRPQAGQPEDARTPAPETAVAAPGSDQKVVAVTEDRPENMRAVELAPADELDDLPPAEPEERPRWRDLEEPAPVAAPPPALREVVMDPPIAGLPACIGCGKHRPIMLTMSPVRPGEKGFRICSGCYRWKTKAEIASDAQC